MDTTPGQRSAVTMPPPPVATVPPVAGSAGPWSCAAPFPLPPLPSYAGAFTTTDPPSQLRRRLLPAPRPAGLPSSVSPWNRASSASAEYAASGVDRVKPQRLPRAVRASLWRSNSLVFFHGKSAPVFSDRPRLGATSAGSKYSTLPRPRQRGQAPCGLLNENSCGLGAGRLMRQAGHTDSVECTMSRPALAVPPFPSPLSFPSFPSGGKCTTSRPSP